MGCCLSIDTSKSSAQKESTSPPPSHPIFEEESVKEVLSETPSLPKKPAAFLTENHDPKKFSSFSPNIPKILDEKLKTHFDGGLRKPITGLSNNPEDFSEVASSEICSNASESFSTATHCTDMNDDIDYDDGFHNRQRSFRHRSLSGNSISMRGRVVGKSPLKRPEPSPGRARSGYGRDARGLGANNGLRRDSGESSSRRSTSPATRTPGGGSSKLGPVTRNGPARKTGKSPGRVKSEAGDKIRKVEDPNSNSIGNSNREGRENKWPPTSNDSLENPLVSLECFIFL